MSIVKANGAGESGSTPFYNDQVTTSLRLNQGSTLTRAYGTSPTSNTTMSFGGWLKFTKNGYPLNTSEYLSIHLLKIR